MDSSQTVAQLSLAHWSDSGQLWRWVFIELSQTAKVLFSVGTDRAVVSCADSGFQTGDDFLLKTN